MWFKSAAMFNTMEFFFTVLMILSVAKSGLSSTPTFNVMQYGAVGDGKSNDSPAFLKAWKDVCQSRSQITRLIIPAGKTFLLKPTTFRGPCKSTYIYIQLSGNMVAPATKSEYIGFPTNAWLGFSDVNGLTISGKGTIDGRGSAWWAQPCLGSSGTKCRPPTALTLNGCYRFALKGLTHVNPARSHITLTSCKNGIISNLRIVAPGNSPNTDGIDISGSRNIQVVNSSIATGDDCVAISGGSSMIKVTGVTCGPGHGISIGSLGTRGSEATDTVEDVHVQNCTLTETLTGVRIKTWQGGMGYARRIFFEKIKFVRANNPIIIDQFYCPDKVDCQNKTLAVKVSNVTYKGIVGTSLTDAAISLNCNQNVGCSNIVFDRVYITSAVPGKKVHSSCSNAHGRATHTKPALNCLLK